MALHENYEANDWTDVAVITCDIEGCVEHFAWNNVNTARLIAQNENGWDWNYSRDGLIRDRCWTHADVEWAKHNRS